MNLFQENVDFFEHIIKKEFPYITISFDGKSSNVVKLLSKNIQFPSNFEDSSIKINSILAHEYYHLIQRKYDKWHRILYNLPQNLSILILPYVFLYPIIFGILLFLCILPIYPHFRIKKEMEAYKMDLLVTITMTNNRSPLPSTWSELFKFTDTSINDISHKLFSYCYFSTLTPQFIKNHYGKIFHEWQTIILMRYFQKRLDFEQKFSYIIDTTTDPYMRVMDYLISKDLQKTSN